MPDKKILVVEDEEDIAVLVSKRLRLEGYAVTRVPDALQAMQLIQKTRPDLVILDLMLPAGGGLSVLERMKMSVFAQDTPVIILTGTQDPAQKKKVLELGVEAFLQKPYDPETLLSEIRRALA